MKKDKIIILRSSTVEKKIISAIAKKCGMSMSEYCRTQALNGEVVAIPQLTPEEVDYYHLLKQYATNFNRISNLIRHHDPQLTKEVKELVSRLTQLQKRLI